MSDVVGSGDHGIPHEAAVDQAINDQLERVSTHAAIADLAVPSAGYVQAEATATKVAVNGILATLRDAGLLPSS